MEYIKKWIVDAVKEHGHCYADPNVLSHCFCDDEMPSVAEMENIIRNKIILPGDIGESTTPEEFWDKYKKYYQDTPETKTGKQKLEEFCKEKNLIFFHDYPKNVVVFQMKPR